MPCRALIAKIKSTFLSKKVISRKSHELNVLLFNIFILKPNALSKSH